MSGLTEQLEAMGKSFFLSKLVALFRGEDIAIQSVATTYQQHAALRLLF